MKIRIGLSRTEKRKKIYRIGLYLFLAIIPWVTYEAVYFDFGIGCKWGRWSCLWFLLFICEREFFLIHLQYFARFIFFNDQSKIFPSRPFYSAIKSILMIKLTTVKIPPLMMMMVMLMTTEIQIQKISTMMKKITIKKPYKRC